MSKRTTASYGDGPSQFGELFTPTGGPGSVPVVILIHGGFWRDAFDLSLMTPLAEDLVGRGYAVWNLEYRRVGSGGGWPFTLDDVADGVDHLAVLAQSHALDLDRVAIVGHSAGGHLALWVAGRGGHDDGAWASPAINPVLTVGQAPVINLELAARENAGTSGRVVPNFLGGGPEEVAERYRSATPCHVEGVEVLIVHGTADVNVLIAWAHLGPDYPTEFIEVADADHFDLIDPSHPTWGLVVTALDRALR